MRPATRRASLRSGEPAELREEAGAACDAPVGRGRRALGAAPGLGDEQRAGHPVPAERGRLDPAVQAAGGHVGELERARARDPDRADLLEEWHPTDYGRVNPFNPCLPYAWSRTCARGVEFGAGFAPFDKSTNWFALQ